MLIVMKATEARLEGALRSEVKLYDGTGKQVVAAETIEEIRADLYLAILELKEQVE